MATLADITVGWSILRDPAPTYRGDAGGRVATIHFLVALNDVTAFVHAIIGTTETVAIPGGGTMERVLPLLYPDDPELLLMSYEVEYFGTPGGTGTSIFTPMYSHARIACEFATLPFGVGGDAPFYTLTTDAGVAVETVPGSAFEFADGSRTTGEWGQQVGVVSFNLTTYMSVTPIGYTAASLVGKTNSAVFDDFPIGTLLNEGMRSEYSRGMFSQSLVKSYALKFRERPWNEVMKADGSWEAPLTVAGGLPRFGSDDLNQLKYL